MRFKGLDLNLLVAFDALLTERGVSAAAARMHLSQPAMSAALNRLREFLGDDILVPFGKRMMPTAYAEQLHMAVRDVLLQVDGLVSASAVFDPETSHRQFRISASDYILEVLIAPVIRRLADLAPHVRLRLLTPSAASSIALGRGEIDLVITPRPFILADQPHELLFADRYVLAGWRGNPVMAAPVTEEIFFQSGHVVTEFSDGRESAFSELQMRNVKRERRIEMVVPSFTAVAPVLVGTKRLALMHQRLALSQARIYPLALAPNPFNFPDLEEMLQFHQTRDRDAGLLWLRQLICAIAAQTLGDHINPPNR